MLTVCSLRGDDSAGYINVNAGNKVITNKAVGPPDTLFSTVGWDRLNLVGDKAIIGHTRKATIGGISKATAHPFSEEHIHGVHNGTLVGWHKLDNSSEFKVDSAALFFNLAYSDPEEVFGKISGAWAAIWWDEEDSTLNFLRNQERPLWWATSEDGKKLYWASEWWMLEMVHQHCGVKFFVDDKGHKYFSLPVDLLRRFEINPKAPKPLNIKPDREIKGDIAQPANIRDPFLAAKGKEEGKEGGPLKPWQDPNMVWSQAELKYIPRVKEIEESGHTVVENSIIKPPTLSVSSTQTPSTRSSKRSLQNQRPTLALVQTPKGGNSNELNDSVKDIGSTSIQSPSSEDNNEGEGKDSNLPFLGWDGLPMDMEEFHALTGSECCFCQSSVTFDEAKTKVRKWIERDRFVCTSCTSQVEQVSHSCVAGC